MSIRTLDQLLLYDYGKQLYDICKKNDWQIDSLMAFWYDLPILFDKADKALSKRALRLKQKSKKFPAEVTEDFVIKVLELTPWLVEKRKKHGLLVFKDGKFSGKLLGQILFMHQFPEEIEDRKYSFPEVIILTQTEETKLKSKYKTLFHQEPMWWWTKEQVVQVMLTKVNKLKVL